MHSILIEEMSSFQVYPYRGVCSTILLYSFSIKSIPVEAQHSILLGPYKYLLKSTLPKLSPREKVELLAQIRAFNFPGFCAKLVGNVVSYHQSFEGRDYKAWAQMAPFVLFPFAEEHRKWLALSKVSSLAWCDLYR